MYITWNVTGVNQVWRLDGADKFPVQMTGGADVTTVQAIAPDDSFVVVHRDRKGEENPGIYILSPNGGPLVEVQHKVGVQTELEFVSDDSKYVYFRSNDVTNDSYAIYRWEHATKKRELVFSEKGIWNVADHRPDGKLLLHKEVGGNMAEVFEWDPAKKVLTPLFGQGEREDYDAKYGAKEGEVLVVTPKFGEFRRLYSWEAAKFTHVGKERNADVSIKTDRIHKRLFLMWNEAGYTKTTVLDGASYKPIELPKLPEGDHVMAGRSTRDGRFTSFFVDTGKGPGQPYVYDWSTAKLTRWLMPSTPEMDAEGFARATLESYPARDGTKIPMFVWQTKACETADKPCPVVVSFHGGPEGQIVAGFNRTAQLFAEAGFVFAAPNVRGSDGYGRSWIHADDGAKRLKVITDIEDAGKYAREKWKRNGIAPKVGIMGGSYGGYSTLAGMTMFPGVYDAGASVVGISNLMTFLQNTAPYRRILRISEYGDPEKDKDALVELSPITHVQKIAAPLLLVQGANDPRVPLGEAIQMFEAVQKREVPTKLVVFPDEGHGSQKRENKVLELGYILDWFGKYLK